MVYFGGCSIRGRETGERPVYRERGDKRMRPASVGSQAAGRNHFFRLPNQPNHRTRPGASRRTKTSGIYRTPY